MTDEDVGPLFGQHTYTMRLRSCINLRPEHCWHLKETRPADIPLQLCCWCAQWRTVENKHVVQHGPWRAKVLHKEGEGTE